jgi:hypothetical protein
MEPFSNHPHKQGLTYLQHWSFAMGIAWRLLSSVVAFAVHAILPFVAIEPRLDLEATSAFLLERNRYVENAASTPHCWRDVVHDDSPAVA